MAYFSNGSEGMAFDSECGSCKYVQAACPIAFVQIEYNYSAASNEIASNILDHLVNNSGACQMKQTFKQDFAIDPNQLNLF